MGKATGKDSAAGKATLVGLIGIEERARSSPPRWRTPSASLSSSATKAATLIEAAHFAASREH